MKFYGYFLREGHSPLIPPLKA